MIKRVALKFGASPGAPALALQDPAVTIFVGPNNSGKSCALREIANFCQTGQSNQGALIIDTMTFSDQGPEAARSALAKLKATPRLNEHVPPAHTLIDMEGNRFIVPEQGFIDVVAAPQTNPSQFAHWWLRFQTLILDGPSRIGLTSSQGRGNLLAPTTSFQRLFTNDVKRSDLRGVLHDALGLYFVLNATEGDQLRVRLSKVAPRHNERALTDDVLEYIRAATPIEEMSDGVKAFTGIITQVMAGDPHVVVVDEPEAFLHPSLAFNLGKEIAKASLKEGKKLFAATHSPQFVMGAIQSGAPVNIVRLTHGAGGSTARLLPKEEMTALWRNPLLRSVGVISALFYDYVVVTEGDTDRAFYNEINERLLSFDAPRGVPNALFLNARNKQTIPSIMAPLRKLGIPTAGVVDIDVVKDGGQEWTKHLAAMSIPVLEHQSFSAARTAVLDALVLSGKDWKRDGGVGVLAQEDKEGANNLFDRLAEYGLFVVRRGELEAWLPTLGAPRNKTQWLPSVFEKMGENPEDPNYVKPAADDVWAFLALVRAWLVASQRKGIPLQ